MNQLTTAKVALFIVGLIVLGYGMRVDSPTLRWIGIGFFGIAFLLRFIKRKNSE